MQNAHNLNHKPMMPKCRSTIHIHSKQCMKRVWPYDFEIELVENHHDRITTTANIFAKEEKIKRLRKRTWTLHERIMDLNQKPKKQFQVGCSRIMDLKILHSYAAQKHNSSSGTNTYGPMANAWQNRNIWTCKLMWIIETSFIVTKSTLNIIS